MQFAFLDGDNVGKALEILLTDGKITEGKVLSLSIIEAMKEIETYLNSEEHLEIIILGGDDILIRFAKQENTLRILEDIRRIFKSRTGLTMSCGIGSTVKEAIWNLHLAKLYGKDTIEGMLT